MIKQPLIKHGWLRVLVFLISFLLIIMVLVRIENLLLILNKINNKTAVIHDTVENQRTFLLLFLSSVTSVIAVIFFRKIIDRKTISSLGFQYSHYASHALTGFSLSFLILGIGTFVLITTGNLHWIDLQVDPKALFLSLGIMIFIALSEEMVFRGYILSNLMDSMHKWIALAVTAFIFTAFHGANPGIDPLALVNLFCGGLLLGVNYIYTKNLWFGILFHFSWNFYQGSVLGYKVSGMELGSVFQHELTGPKILSGRNFGFEGSIICGLLCLLFTILLVWVYEKKKYKSLAVAAV